jgi:hypothetical protein
MRPSSFLENLPPANILYLISNYYVRTHIMLAEEGLRARPWRLGALEVVARPFLDLEYFLVQCVSFLALGSLENLPPSVCGADLLCGDMHDARTGGLEGVAMAPWFTKWSSRTPPLAWICFWYNASSLLAVGSPSTIGRLRIFCLWPRITMWGHA